jgi:hypothetical protein
MGRDIHTREMQVTNRELRSVNMHRQIHLATPAEVLDIAVSTVLRTARDSPRTLAADLGLGLLIRTTGVNIDRLRWVGDFAVQLVRFDQIALTLVPRRQDLGGGCTAQDTGVDEAGELDVGDVAGGAEDALEIPDSFCSGAVLVKGRLGKGDVDGCIR